MDIIEVAYWAGWVGLFLTGAVIELVKIMIKEFRKFQKIQKKGR